MDIAIIGAGAAGLFAGGYLAPKHKVTIFDGNEKCGKKLYITGKGRCNITNYCEKEEYLDNVVNGKRFMMSAISQFTPQNTIEFFNSLGLKTKVERGNRVFPISDKSNDVIKALLKHCEGCQIRLEEKVKSVQKQNDKLVVKTLKSEQKFDKVIIATGGKSYPLTGSDGDGYNFARKIGHSIVKPCSALVAIELDDAFVKQIQGLPLKNVEIKSLADKKKYQLFGEMMFTEIGMTGPIVLSLSRQINKANDISLSIDFKPALEREKLVERLKRDFNANLNKNISYIIKGLLPNNLVPIFLNTCQINGDKKVNSITVIERNRIVETLKNFPLKYKKLYPLESGIVTSGGVELKEINPKTMESKLCSGLYFIGEVLDVDCLTGGFNLQTAFSTAYSCQKAINKEEIC